jgi:hypothetical protein
MSDQSPRLTLPFLLAGQAQKHVAVNDAFALLDALVHLAIESRTIAAEPAAPADGAVYLLPEGRTGERWSALPVGALVRFDYGWSALPAPDGLIALVKDEGVFLARKAGVWSELATGGGSAPPPTELQNLTRLGLGTIADAANPLAAKLGKALFAAKPVAEGGDGDLRLTFNKEAGSDVLSLLFQSGFSGRAELGLVGDDDLRLKVSPDGATWKDAFTVDRTSGRTTFAVSPQRAELTVFTADGAYPVPAWARRLQVTVIGGGGGGGAGLSAAGGARFGGGGGGAGGRSDESYDTADLPATLAVTVGAGGAGGLGAAGPGAAGDAGADSVVADGATVLLVAGGGAGGKAGGTGGGSGAGGAAGSGTSPGSPGGGSLSSTVGGAGSSVRGDAPGSGGAGGAVDGSSNQRAGGPGGAGYASGGSGRSAAPGSGGSAANPGGDGHGKVWTRGCGAGGGGGGGANAGSGGSGGDGGAPGGGGGGGGASASGFAGGSGGPGGRGEVWILATG